MISSLGLFHCHLGCARWPCGRLLNICANFVIRTTIWFLFCCNYCPVLVNSHCRIARIAILHSGHAVTFNEVIHIPTSYRPSSYWPDNQFYFQFVHSRTKSYHLALGPCPLQSECCPSLSVIVMLFFL